MTVVTNETGQVNIFAKEPKMYITEEDMSKTPHNERAELLNGRLAMLGVIAALGAYALTGQIIPGVW
jgi:Chlorophyll A-B binding protein